MTIQLANRSIVQPLGVLEDVLVQVNELIFLADFYVLHMEDETFGKESTLILGRPFLMTARTKIDVHVGTLSMEFEKANYEEVQDLPNSKDNHNDIADLDFEAELSEMLDQVCNLENLECTNHTEVEVAKIKRPISTIFTAEIKLAKEGQVKEKMKVNSAEKLSSKADTLAEAKPANEDHKQTRAEFTIPSRSDSEAAQEADADSNSTRIELTNRSRPKQPKAEIMSAYLVPSPNQRRLNPTILDVVKKEVTKLLAAGIIYPISDSEWVSPMQVVPKKSGMTVMKNQQDELVPMQIQNSWRVCIDYRRLNQETRNDHFPLPFIDQVLEKLSGYMQIHIAPEY
ncbi:hypothetical protein CR513_40028, partial [Mucuna pruriens]